MELPFGLELQIETTKVNSTGQVPFRFPTQVSVLILSKIQF